jgi:hypothetical protein
MRVVEADDQEPAPPRFPSPLDVILRVDQEAGPFLVRGVTCSHRLRHIGIAAKQQPATFIRRCLPSVRHDRVERDATDAYS